MIIEIQKLPPQGMKISEDFEFISSELVEQEAVFLDSVHSKAEIKKIGDKIIIRGEIKTRLNLLCSRCLSPFDYPIISSFDLIYLPVEKFELKEELEIEDLENLFYANDQIDLKQIILDQLNLSIPLKPLCSEECQGLCPICGQELKNGQCGCEVDSVDPRLQKLTFFLKK
ncbi:MAG: DUF177 domain-containing protein [Candidatus Aminicenantia bacterium]